MTESDGTVGRRERAKQAARAAFWSGNQWEMIWRERKERKKKKQNQHVEKH
jgi:hypothetical protein